MLPGDIFGEGFPSPLRIHIPDQSVLPFLEVCSMPLLQMDPSLAEPEQVLLSTQLDVRYWPTVFISGQILVCLCIFPPLKLTGRAQGFQTALMGL